MGALFGGLSLLRLGIYGAIAVAILAGGYTTYRVWRHSVWVEGRDAALDAVKAQDSRAVATANRVEVSMDKCDEAGGYWDVSLNKCVTDGFTPSGVRGLFGDAGQ